MGSRVYAGRTASTRTERVVYSCPCGERFAAEVWRAVDVRDEAEAKKLQDGTLNRVQCPSCEARAEVQVPVVFHDGARERLVLVLPDGLRHRELGRARGAVRALADDGVAPPAYVLAPEVVFGAAGLRALLAPPASRRRVRRSLRAGRGAAHERPGEQPALLPSRRSGAPTSRTLALLPSLQEDETPAAAAGWGRPGSTAHARADRASSDNTRPHVTRARSALGGDRALDRRPRGAGGVPRRGPGAFVRGAAAGGARGVLARARRAARAAASAAVVSAVGADAAWRSIRRAARRGRGRRRRASCRWRSTSRAPRTAWCSRRSAAAARSSSSCTTRSTCRWWRRRSRAPLEENVRRLVAEAKDALERLAPATRSFERARTQFLSPGYDRLGRTPIDLPAADDALDRPGLVRAALSTVARWSEPNAEAYLMEIRSLPLGEWRQLRARVVRRALDTGIAVPRPLVERTVKDHDDAAAVVARAPRDPGQAVHRGGRAPQAERPVGDGGGGQLGAAHARVLARRRGHGRAGAQARAGVAQARARRRLGRRRRPAHAGHRRADGAARAEGAAPRRRGHPVRAARDADAAGGLRRRSAG